MTDPQFAPNKTQTGLQLLVAMFSGQVAAPPFAATLGFGVVEASDGEVVVESKTEPRLLGPFGVVHGGFISTLLDTALTCAVISTLPAGLICTTTDLHVRYVRALPADAGRLRAVGRVVHRGRQVATSEGKVIDDAGRVYATATMACFVFAARGPESGGPSN